MKEIKCIAIGFILCVVLSACYEDSPSTDYFDYAPITTTPVAIELTTPAALELTDMGVRTLRIGAWWDCPINEIMWGNEPDPHTNPIEHMMWENTRRVEHDFNVQFESVSVPYDDFLTTLAASVLDGEPFADVVVLAGWMQLESMFRIIQPWDWANLPDSDVFGAQIYASPTTRFGNHVWVINPNRINDNAFGLGVNLDI